MRRLYLLIIGFALAVGLSSCEENITLDLPNYEPKLAVFCVLHPGENPVLYLNRSKSYFDYSDSSQETEYIADAQVVITDVTAGINDTLKFSFTERYYEGKIIPVAGQKYILNIWHKGKHVTAETMVPKAVEITGIINKLDSESYVFDTTKISYYNGSIVVKYMDAAGEQNAYSLKMQQPSRFGDTTTMYEQSDYSFNYDLNSDGREMQNEIFTSINTYDNEFDSMVVYLQIENYTTATADYVESVREQGYTNGDPTTEPVIIKHNITGGLGVFGASTLSKKARLRIW